MTSYDKDIKTLFSANDRACMLNIPMFDNGKLDLNDYSSTKKYAGHILLEIALGDMPQGGQKFDLAQLKTFALWIDEGFPS